MPLEYAEILEAREHYRSLVRMAYAEITGKEPTQETVDAICEEYGDEPANEAVGYWMDDLANEIWETRNG